MSEEPIPNAPASISRRTSSRIRSSSAGGGGRSSRPLGGVRGGGGAGEGGGAEVGGDVRSDPLPLHVREVLGERDPGDVELQVALIVLHLLPHSLAERSHGPALAEDLGGDALADLALGTAVHQQGLGGPGQPV